MISRIAIAFLLIAVAAGVTTGSLLWEPWDSDDPSTAPSSSGHTDSPLMSLEGVLALVSRQYAGCAGQPNIVLSADVVYEGNNKWKVTYSGYRWEVDEATLEVKPIGDPFPCRTR